MFNYTLDTLTKTDLPCVSLAGLYLTVFGPMLCNIRDILRDIIWILYISEIILSKTYEHDFQLP